MVDFAYYNDIQFMSNVYFIILLTFKK